MAKGGERRRVLLVDDEDTIIEAVGEHLMEVGYDVVGVATGEEALECLRKERYDVVLLDILLPGIDGLEVLRRMRADLRLKEIPVAFLTVLGESAHVLDGFEIGGNAYVVKPLDLERISEVVGLLTRETRAQ